MNTNTIISIIRSIIIEIFMKNVVFIKKKCKENIESMSLISDVPLYTD